MTQTTPTAPSQGIVVPPTAVAAGVTSTVPFPTPVMGGPTPWRTPWVVLLNSSPYTLIVSTGSTTTQIAAFTSDKVYVFSTGLDLPVTVTPQPGAGIPNPASDFTVYATWYHDEPPGTYPAALGSGAVADQLNSEVGVVAQTMATSTSVDVGPFSTAGFGGLAIFAQELTGNGPLTISVLWLSQTAAALASRTIVVPAGGTAAFTIPNFGPTCDVTVINVSGVSIQAAVHVSQTLLATASWSTDRTVLIPATLVACPNATPTVIGSGLYTYAGPASLWMFWNTTTVGQCSVQYQLGNGTWQTISGIGIGAAPAVSTLTEPVPVTILLPPNPVRLLVNQTSGGPTTPLATLTTDDWRISA